MNTVFNEKDILLALSDLNMDVESVEIATSLCKQGKIDALKRLLTQHRSSLLSIIHKDQDRLYRLDYILEKMK